ncbi:MAG: CRISPR-associated protein Cas4 [Thermoproteus sp.]
MASPCINPALVRQYLYCPTAAYYIVAGAAEPPTERMRKGKEAQDEAVEAVAKALGAEAVERQRRLEGGGFCGVVDAVLWIGGRPAPLEVKQSAWPGKTPLHHKAQMGAYLAAAQAVYGKAAPRGYIYYAEDGRAVEVRNTRDLQQLVLHVAAQIAKMYRGWVPQPNPHPAKCPGCWYRKWCGVEATKVEKI